MELPGPHSTVEKMVFLLERINESRVISRLQKVYPLEAKEDYLVNFRQVFFKYYQLDNSQPHKNNSKLQEGDQVLHRILL